MVLVYHLYPAELKPRKGSHSIFSIRLHLVFVTKYRRNVLSKAMLERLGEVFSRVCVATNCILIEFSGEPDHVHLLIDFHPDNKVSQLVSSLKSASSRILRQEFADELNKVYRKSVLWSGSYYVASSEGAPIEKLKEYIQSQESPAT